MPACLGVGPFSRCLCGSSCDLAPGLAVGEDSEALSTQAELSLEVPTEVERRGDEGKIEDAVAFVSKKDRSNHDATAAAAAAAAFVGCDDEDSTVLETCQRKFPLSISNHGANRVTAATVAEVASVEEPPATAHASTRRKCSLAIL
ncbi:unnamed protein product [Schistocephalus solidus]|uniref:Uncharacterized protein n=1 Tax=Schistocephalus solidus TaxID=70667 RepID=A0A183SUI8_SCHSO|nr:unnamed protein product [Schistocephalus solidus]